MNPSWDPAQDRVTRDALDILKQELLEGPPVAVGVWWLWRCFNAHIDQHSRAAVLALTYRHRNGRNRLVLVDMIALEQANQEEEHLHKDVLGQILNAPHVLKVVHFLERTALRALQLAFVTEDVRQGPTKPESYISISPCVDMALVVACLQGTSGVQCNELFSLVWNFMRADMCLTEGLSNFERRPLRKTQEHYAKDVICRRSGKRLGQRLTGAIATHVAEDQEVEFLVQQIRSLCHDRKGIRHEMEQLDQRCRTEAVELRAQLSAAQARFAAAKLDGDRLRRELAGPWEEGNAAAIQEMRFLQTHVEGLRVGCGMVAEHMTSMRAEVANYQSRVEQLYAEDLRSSGAGAAEDQRSATESELRRVREAMLQSFQETSELQQKFLLADQDFAAVKEAAAKDAHTAVQTLEEELLSVREEEALCWKKCEDAKARLITARSEEAAALAELQLKDEHLNNLRRLYEREREGSFLREEQFMQSQRKSLQDQSEKLEKSGGLISIEMHERILHDQTEPSQVGLLRGEIAAEACATATMEQDAELLEEQIRDSADLFTLRAALSSRHQEIAEFEAKMIEAQDEELRLRKKLPLLEAQAADSASQAEAWCAGVKSALAEDTSKFYTDPAGFGLALREAGASEADIGLFALILLETRL
eukprot:s894_g5.t2